jgi:hypothetical protein
VKWGIRCHLQPCLCPHFLLYFPLISTWCIYFTAIVHRIWTGINTKTSRKYLHFVEYVWTVVSLLFLFCQLRVDLVWESR